jgi:hypothetical protein
LHKRLVLLAALSVSLITAGPAAAGTHGQQLSPVLGQGAGIVNVTSLPGDPGLTVNVTINVHNAAPNTTFFIQRAPETGIPQRPLSNDGICQRAEGIAPWVAAVAFVTNPRPLAGDLITLTTGAEGNGTAHFILNFPPSFVPDGTVFDVELRLVDSLIAPTTDLRTECFTVTAK